MNNSLIKVFSFLLISAVVLWAINTMIAGSAHPDLWYFRFDIAFFIFALLASRTARILTPGMTGLMRSIGIEYLFSFSYLMFCILCMSVYSHLNVAVLVFLFVLWHTRIIKGIGLFVPLALMTFNAIVRWEKIFYIVLITPAAYLVSLFLTIAFCEGLATAMGIIFPGEDDGADSEERIWHLKWWAFLGGGNILVDARCDLNLDKVEVLNVKKSEHKSIHDTAFLQIQSPAVLSESLTRIGRRDGLFAYDVFLKRAGMAFRQIQEALDKRAVESIEHLVSDGLFEQFRYQIREREKKASRTVSVELTVNDMQIAQVNLESGFDVLHLFVRAVSRDYEAAAEEKDIRVDEIRADRRKVFTERVICEYWSFLRKPSAQTKNAPGLLEGQCPNCGKPLQIGQVTVCPACSSFIRSGQYDWVLSRITRQALGFILSRLHCRAGKKCWRLMAIFPASK
jgi:hypothetical protein